MLVYFPPSRGKDYPVKPYFAPGEMAAAKAAITAEGPAFYEGTCYVYHRPSVGVLPSSRACSDYQELGQIEEASRSSAATIRTQADAVQRRIDDFESALSLSLDTAVINNAEIVELRKLLTSLNDKLAQLSDAVSKTDASLDSSVEALERDVASLIQRIDGALPNYQ
jgi:hypothetical protein